MSAILSLSRLSKSFGAIVIADQLDLELAEGEALGMLGPNGAGKTTIFGMITGTLAPDWAGSISPDATSRRCRRHSAAGSASPAPSRFRSHSAA